MSTVKLQQFGETFATRERAREVALAIAGNSAELTLDAEGVLASPSFLAEFLSVLSENHRSVVIEGASEHLGELALSIVGKLDLKHVRVTALA